MKKTPNRFQHAGFTLIELLTVIGIIGVLAALILPVAGAVKKHQYIYNTQAEMAKLETAIDRYKAAYGFYPPVPLIRRRRASRQRSSTSSIMNWWEPRTTTAFIKPWTTARKSTPAMCPSHFRASAVS